MASTRHGWTSTSRRQIEQKKESGCAALLFCPFCQNRQLSIVRPPLTAETVSSLIPPPSSAGTV